jgi:hypothetical protein
VLAPRAEEPDALTHNIVFLRMDLVRHDLADALCLLLVASSKVPWKLILKSSMSQLKVPC